jgi:hypothetical protein
LTRVLSGRFSSKLDSFALNGIAIRLVYTQFETVITTGKDYFLSLIRVPSVRFSTEGEMLKNDI